LSAVHDHFMTYQKHLVRLLSHTGLDKIHWLNLNQRSITLKTLLNDSATNDSVTSSPR
jgi:hypothetical protein